MSNKNQVPGCLKYGCVGCLSALALSGQRWLGAVTPLGGAAFIAGWALLAWQFWRLRGA